ncbi:DUF3883 domain-containing protein [Salinicola rhizosphaerae]|uniref:Protein NO VEIN C-terminal domain-containing protein n=1 Tax=Salinicola rhizosphaerae TaxID=1443141 RepID=A0ABQ3DU85_9GAMM|nr:DUF3883 domain-containing protein [Salinicola rhizosphaerae]GHB13232.1 hypothetical protein GCM10009038_09260 [Salinicola rhizosphaerae]
MPQSHWSVLEVEAIVATYRQMLVAELSGQRYNKSQLNQALMERLQDRSRSSIEYKHRNISAVLRDADCPYVDGYKPLGNYQGMLVEAVERVLLGSEIFDRAARSAAERPAVDSAEPAHDGVIVMPPEASQSHHEINERPAAYERRPIKRDYLAREAHNRELGLSGERFVVSFEQRRLRQAGESRLADRVEHIAETQGDGAGFDVLSFEPNGRERWIEVKTTAFAKESAFFITPNELACSRDNAERYHLFRLFTFRHKPRMFCLQGDMSDYLCLEPNSYRAGIR